MAVERSVSYDLETYDDLPDGEFTRNGKSPLEDQLQRIMYDPERHAPRWARIGRYESASHVAAAGSAAAVLRKRHGETQDVEGWRFETRRIEDGGATGLFAQYNPKVIEPGKREENAERYEEHKEQQRERARQRAEARAEANVG